MVDNRLGIELDGVRATVVEVVGHSAVSSHTVVGSDPADALKKAVADVKNGKKAPKIRVSLVSSNAAVRRIDITAKALSDRSAFEDAVHAAIPNVRDTASAAGLFFNADTLVGSNLGSGLAAVAPREAVEDAYQALSAFPDVEIVPPAFTLIGLNGLHLAVRYSNADITLVENGYPVLHRQLSVGGLQALATSLAPGEAGVERLEATINNMGSPDPLAQDALGRYLRSLASEVAKTRTHWMRGGETVPEEVFVYGSGGRIRDLVDALADVELKQVTNEDLVRRIAYIPLGAREGATGAFLAGATAGIGAPASAYPSPVAQARALTARKNTQRTRRLLVGALALALPLAAYFGPITAGRVAINDAQTERDAAQSRFDAVSTENQLLAKVDGLENAYETIASEDPRWSSVLTRTYASAAEAGATVTSFSTDYSGEDIVVTASASALDPGATYSPLTRWISLIEDKESEEGLRATQVSTSGFQYSDTDQSTSFQVRFVITSDDDRIFNPRSLSGEEE